MMANPMMGFGMNPAIHPSIIPTHMQAQNQNPQLMTFSSLITEDYKIAKVMEINNRLLEW